MEDLRFLIWSPTHFSTETEYAQIHDWERAHENPRLRSIMKGVTKAVGPHSCACTCGLGRLQAAGTMAGGLKPVTRLSVMWQLYFVFPSIWKVC